MSSANKSALQASLKRLATYEGIYKTGLNASLGAELRDSLEVKDGDDEIDTFKIVEGKLRELIKRLDDPSWQLIARVTFNVDMPEAFRRMKLMQRHDWLGRRLDTSSSKKSIDRRLDEIRSRFERWLLDGSLPTRKAILNPAEAAHQFPQPQVQEATSVPLLADSTRAALESLPLRSQRALSRRTWITISAGALAILLVGTASVMAMTRDSPGTAGKSSTVSGAPTSPAGASAHREPSRSAPPSPSAPPQSDDSLFKVTVLTNPAQFTFGEGRLLNTANAFLFPRGKIASIPNPDGSCPEWHRWAYANGGIDLYQKTIAINVAPQTEAVVQVLGADLHVAPVKNPLVEGDATKCDQGDETTQSHLLINLEQRKAEYRYYSSPSDNQGKVSPLLLTIKRDNPELIFVQASGWNCYCEWYLDMHIQVAGKDFVKRIDNKGEPFVIASDQPGAYTTYDYDTVSQRWCVNSCA